MKRRQSPRRTKYSRDEAPLGTVRVRDAGNGQSVRMVKVRMDGPTGKRWIHYARWWWELNRGPVPAGRRICHADGNLLNDEPDNLVALTPGEVFKLYHGLDPAMSRRNRAACGRAAARLNVIRGERRRAASWLPTMWYGVDFARREVHNRPRRKRWMVYADHGFPELLALHVRSKVRAARAGDTDAAAFVVRQAQTLPSYWRRVRSLSLGWPGVNCMAACVLDVLAAADRPMRTRAIVAAVSAMRELYGWRPHRLERGVLSSIASMLGPRWIRSERSHEQRGESRWSVGPAALADRLDVPRIVPVKGRDLGRPWFEGFRKIDAPNEKAVA